MTNGTVSYRKQFTTFFNSKYDLLCRGTQNNSCTSTNRTSVEVRIFSLPATTNEEIVKCQSANSIQLDAGLSNVSYLWSAGENTQITVTSIGTYTVTSQIVIIVLVKKTIKVIERNKPAISSVDVKNLQLLLI
jgi:hypothetical protein